MRFAIMSDIHAYPAGLARAYEDAKCHGAEAFICLGDYVGYGPDPEGAIELSRRMFGEQTVMGNHDAALVRQFSARSFSSRVRKSIDRQREIISKENWKWLKSRRALVFEEPLLGLHGDIRMEDGRLVPGFGYVFRPEDADRVFAAVSCIPVRVICVGHTHEPAIWRSRTGGSAELLDTERVEVGPMERYLVNVGSVGCPRTVPYASYAIVEMSSDSHRIVIELHKLDFDYQAYRDALLAAQADVPIWLEDRCRVIGDPDRFKFRLQYRIIFCIICAKDWENADTAMSLFLQLLGNGLVQGAVAVLYAACFGFVYRSFRVFHIAMGAQFVFACYAFYTCAAVCKLPIVVSVPAVLVLSAAFAALIECAVYRPFAQKRCSSGVVMIASLGVMIVLENVVALIEHNMGVVRKLADYIYFLHEGTVYTHGTQQDVLDNPEVRDLYTGNSGGAML